MDERAGWSNAQPGEQPHRPVHCNPTLTFTLTLTFALTSTLTLTPTGEFLLWSFPLAVLYVVLMGAAWAFDQGTRYTTAVPHWAQAGARGFPLWRQFAFHARTQLMLLRPFHVMYATLGSNPRRADPRQTGLLLTRVRLALDRPDRTAYTTVQSVHTCFVSATLNCLGSLLFSQGQQCSALATYSAIGIAGLTCSFPALIARRDSLS